MPPAANRGLEELKAELRIIQRRLGTPSEAPDDFNRVLAIAHAINNQLTIVRAQEYLQSLAS